MRWLFVPVMAWIGRALRARVLLGRTVAGWHRGIAPPPEVLDRIRPGETTYEDVLRLCGPGVEEQVRLPARETQALVYRAQRVVPRRGWSLGWFATVRYWDVEDREVAITFESNRVRDIQARVRRARRRDRPPA
jgi:acetolactate synthase regulatory subunit